MKYLSLFTGIGGFEKGIEQAFQSAAYWKPKCIGFSEIDKYAASIYQKHYPKHKNYGDITKIKTEELPAFDLLVGGFPCQSFSIAGKRGGFDDTRGTLFFEIARILKDKRPKQLLLENVKGLLSHDGGRTFKTIIATLTDLGYCIQWQVLNSKDFGVPQNRERIFIVGYLGRTPRFQIFPIGEAGGDAEPGDSQEAEQPSSTITSRYGRGNGRGTHIIQKSPDWRKDGTLREFKDFAPSIRSQMGDNHPMVIRVPEATRGGYAEAGPGDSINLAVPNSKTRRGRVGKGVAQTLDTGMQQHTISHDMRIRRLTPTECERLQGFPDGWTDGVSDTQRYKCLGNAVTVNVIEAIISRMIQ